MRCCYMGLKIVVTAPAHLHVGNMDLTGDLGRLYGTVGFTLNYPKTVVEIRKSSSLKVSGEDEENALKYAKKMLETFNVKGGVHIYVKEAIPKHVGMGSQTALALSIGLGIKKLYGLEVSLKEVALTLGRSTVSALGFYSFTVGGFIIDGGFKVSLRGKMIPPLIFNKPIPENWFFVVALPYRPLSEILKVKAEEDKVLGSLKPMPKELSEKLSRIVLMKMMPAFAEEDIKEFGEAITMFNRTLGEFWSQKQKGIYCCDIVEEGIRIMLENGAYGACQTSWGPTFYGLVKGERKAEEIMKLIRDYINSVGGGKVFYVRGNNSGAKVLEVE